LISATREWYAVTYILTKAYFLVDTDGQLWVTAFRQVNFLPETFMYFALGK
jgi:hypothetical protein